MVLIIPLFAEKVSLNEPFRLNPTMKTDEELRQSLNPWDWFVLVVAIVSLLLVIYKIAFPRITTLGKLPSTEIYR